MSTNDNNNNSIQDPRLNHQLPLTRRAPWAKVEPRQPQASSSRSYIDSQLRLGPSCPQASASGSCEPLRERRAVPRQEPTRPEKGRPLVNNFHPPWLTSQLSSSNVEEGTPSLTMDEIKGTVKTLMRGFYCKVPYAYYHRLTHATLSRPTEFVRQIPVPAIKYLKKESWPVYNKYIGSSLDRAMFKRRIHIAAEPAYVVPESECQPTASTSFHPRQVREIVSKAKRRYQTKVINSHQQQEQFGYPTPVLEPRKPTAISSSTLSLPPRPSTKPSPGTAAIYCQPTSSDNSIHPLAACGASTKRKLDAVAPSVMNANKKLKAVHQASQLIATFQLAQEPKAIAASSEAGHCTVAPQATVTGTLNASASSAANKEGTYEQGRR
ncbi:hypothetical protein G6F67_004677 [Rhizopus microsporus]|nr:hypothetical protein G6F67_004677 [Rhizopus microsporus]